MIAKEESDSSPRMCGRRQQPARSQSGANRERRLESQLAGAASAALVCALALSSLLIVRVQSMGGIPAAASSKVAVFQSENMLRNTIERLTVELRELKRNFVDKFENLYEPIKSDTSVGIGRAARGREAALAATLINEQLAETLFKVYTIRRRLLAGLKFVFTRLLPLNTIKRLLARHKSFAWLEGKSQMDLRPLLAGADESEFVTVYTLIELRARLRASDDLVTVTSENLARILKAVQALLIERSSGSRAEPYELSALAGRALGVLRYYRDEVFGQQQALQTAYENQLRLSEPLVPASLSGPGEFVRFVDGLIDAEALDLELSEQANGLERPPTISEQMIRNVEKKWIPQLAREHLIEDQSVLLRFRSVVKPLVRVSSLDENLARRCEALAMYLAQPRSYY